MKNVMISQANALTLSRYDFSRVEKNVLYVIFQQVRHEYVEGSMPEGRWKNLIVHITIEQFGKVAGEKHANYAWKSLQELGRKEVEFIDKEGIPTWTHLLNYAKDFREKGYYEVEVSKELLPYLVELVGNFTSYQLTVAMALKSKYSQRFYEICSQFKNIGRFFLTQKKIREMFLLEKKYFQNQDFRRKILDVAQKELKEFFESKSSDLWFEYVQMGRGDDIKYFFRIHYRYERQRQEDVIIEKGERLYIISRFKEIFPNDHKYVSRVKHYLELNVDDVHSIYSRLYKLEMKEGKKGADLARLLRHILREDYKIE